MLDPYNIYKLFHLTLYPSSHGTQSLQHTSQYILVSTRTFDIHSFSSICSLDFFPVHWYWSLNLNMISWSGKNKVNPGDTAFSCKYWTNLKVLLFLAVRRSLSSQKRGKVIFLEIQMVQKELRIQHFLMHLQHLFIPNWWSPSFPEWLWFQRLPWMPTTLYGM